MNDEQKTAWTLSWKSQNEAFARKILKENHILFGNIKDLSRIIFVAYMQWMKTLVA